MSPNLDFETAQPGGTQQWKASLVHPGPVTKGNWKQLIVACN